MKKMMLISLSSIALLTASAAVATEPSDAPINGKELAHKGKKFEENDTNKDNFISKDEWRARGDKMFNETDANGDGKLTQEEMKARHEKKRAEWKDRREERKEKMGEMREKLQERKASSATTSSVPAAAE